MVSVFPGLSEINKLPKILQTTEKVLSYLTLALVVGFTVFFLLPHLARQPSATDPSPEPYAVSEFKAKKAARLYAQALKAQKTEGNTAAYKLFFEAMSYDPWNIKHLEGAAPVAFDTGKYQRAARWYNRLTLLYKKKQNSHSDVIRCLTRANEAYYQLGDYDRAHARIDEALDLTLARYGAKSQHFAKVQLDFFRTAMHTSWGCQPSSIERAARRLGLDKAPTLDYLERLLEVADCVHAAPRGHLLRLRHNEVLSLYLDALIIAEKLEPTHPGTLLATSLRTRVVEAEVRAGLPENLPLDLPMKSLLELF